MIKLAFRPSSSGGGNNEPRRFDGPDPDGLRSPSGTSGALTSGTLIFEEFCTIFDINISI